MLEEEEKDLEHVEEESPSWLSMSVLAMGRSEEEQW